MNNRIPKIIAVALMIGLNWAGLSAVGETVAAFNDTETSDQNAFTAGVLDISAGSNFSAEIIDSDVSQAISVDHSHTDIPGQYDITIAEAPGSDHTVCEALQVDFGDYSGDLLGLEFSTIPMPVSPSETYPLSISTTAPITDDLDGKTCRFDLAVSAWQSNIANPSGGGFSDAETISGAITVRQRTTDAVSSIKDSYVRSNSAASNYGTATAFYVDARSTAKYRSFVGFDFHLPVGTTILSSNLLLYMSTAPTASRTYEAKRALASWIESGTGGITWNNQPAVYSSASSVVTTGTTGSRWLSWDVASDVRDIVSGAISNYGWGVSDTDETTTVSRRATFVSRNATTASTRPQLEVSFSVPPAQTDHLVVNEVYYDVNSSKGAETTNEWVEIYNPTSANVDLSNWKICDTNTSCDTIPAGNILGPRKFAVIVASATTWDYWPDMPADALKINLNSNTGNGLSDSGDSVILKNASGAKIDSMSYGSVTTELNPAVTVSRIGNSLARIVKGYDANTANDWIVNATPNPGTNPSSSGAETIRFTDEGVMVADYAVGLEPLEDGIATEPVVEMNEPAPGEAVVLSTEEKAITEASPIAEEEENEESAEVTAREEDQTSVAEEVALPEIHSEDASEPKEETEEPAVQETPAPEEDVLLEPVFVEEYIASEPEEIAEASSPEIADDETGPVDEPSKTEESPILEVQTITTTE